jgi:hypothetical protein
MIKIGPAGSNGLGNLKGVGKVAGMGLDCTEQFFMPLAKELVRRDLDITIINESPSPYEDAVMMKGALQRLDKRRSK